MYFLDLSGWCLVPLEITHALECNLLCLVDLHMLVFINCMSLVHDITGLLYLVSHSLILLVMCALMHISHFFPCVRSLSIDLCSLVFAILHLTSYQYTF